MKSKIILAGVAISFLVILIFAYNSDWSPNRISNNDHKYFKKNSREIASLPNNPENLDRYKNIIRELIRKTQIPPDVRSQVVFLENSMNDFFKTMDRVGLTQLQKNVLDFAAEPGNVNIIDFEALPYTTPAEEFYSMWDTDTKNVRIRVNHDHLKGEFIMRSYIHELTHGYMIKSQQASHAIPSKKGQLGNNIVSFLDREFICFVAEFGDARTAMIKLLDSPYVRELNVFDAIFPEYINFNPEQKMYFVNKMAEFAVTKPAEFLNFKTWLDINYANFYKKEALLPMFYLIKSDIIDPVLRDPGLASPRPLSLLADYNGALGNAQQRAAGALSNQKPNIVSSVLGDTGNAKLTQSSIQVMGENLDDLPGNYYRQYETGPLKPPFNPIHEALNKPNQLVPTGLTSPSEGKAVVQAMDQATAESLIYGQKIRSGTNAFVISNGESAAQTAARAADQSGGTFVAEYKTETNLHPASHDGRKVQLGGGQYYAPINSKGIAVVPEKIALVAPKTRQEAILVIEAYERELAMGLQLSDEGRAFYEGLKSRIAKLPATVLQDGEVIINGRSELEAKLNNEIRRVGNINGYMGNTDYLTGASKNNLLSRVESQGRRALGAIAKGANIVAIAGPLAEGVGAAFGTVLGGGNTVEGLKEGKDVIIDGQLSFIEDLLTMAIRIGRDDNNPNSWIPRKMARAYRDGLNEYFIDVRYQILKMVLGEQYAGTPARFTDTFIKLNDAKLNSWQYRIMPNTLNFLYALSGFGITDYVGRRLNQILAPTDPVISLDNYYDRLSSSEFRGRDVRNIAESIFEERKSTYPHLWHEESVSDLERLIEAIYGYIDNNLRLVGLPYTNGGFDRFYEYLFPVRLLPPEEWDPGSYEYRYGQGQVLINGSPFTIDYATGVMSGGGNGQ